MVSNTAFTPYSTLRGNLPIAPSFIPQDEQDRISAYAKYEEMYWNDARAYALRVLEGEEPVYIPNARTVCDTTSHYLLKGLQVSSADSTTSVALTAFLERELFYSRFHTAKHAGVVRGDFVMHLTADPKKEGGRRLSLNSVDPARVFPIWHDDIPDKMIGCHIIDIYTRKEDPNKEFIRKLTYRLEENEATGKRRISREEAIFEIEPKWFGPDAKKVEQVLPLGYLDDRITSIPVYWFKNIGWDGWDYGASEIKGIETLVYTVSQGITDVTGSLSLEGLGVYATDGGRPIDDAGNEVDWEISPGKVMEVPSGSYFRRVEGVGSITPATDQIEYLESKMREVSGLSDVALGRVDVATAQSGIALAIKFMPTLAKIEERDIAGLGKLNQLFFDWKVWHEVFEHQSLNGDILVEIGAKLPQNRLETINELNNMLDRKIISRQYYREAMAKLGYDFPEDLEEQIQEELNQDAERAAMAAPPNLQENAAAAARGDLPPPPNGGVGSAGNRSNNRNRVNESNGTEADPEK